MRAGTGTTGRLAGRVRLPETFLEGLRATNERSTRDSRWFRIRDP